MGKSKTSEIDQPEFDSGNSTAVKYEQSVYLKHRLNQANDYKWGGRYYRFEAHERKKVSKEVLNTRQFDKFAKYFTIESDKKGE